MTVMLLAIGVVACGEVGSIQLTEADTGEAAEPSGSPGGTSILLDTAGPGPLDEPDDDAGESPTHTVEGGRFLHVAAYGDRTNVLCAGGWIDYFGASKGLPPGDDFVRIAAGSTATAGITRDGVLHGGEDYADPGEVTKPVQDVALGRFAGCATHTDGTVGCWPGDWTNGLDEEPEGAHSSVSVAPVGDKACALDANLEIVCWGFPDPELVNTPKGPFRQVVLLETGGCARDPEGYVSCWDLGPGADPAEPTQRFMTLVAGDDAICGIDVDGHIACWGGDFPTPPDGEFVEVAVGREHGCALGVDGHLECWWTGASEEAATPLDATCVSRPEE